MFTNFDLANFSKYPWHHMTFPYAFQRRHFNWLDRLSSCHKNCSLTPLPVWTERNPLPHILSVNQSTEHFCVIIWFLYAKWFGIGFLYGLQYLSVKKSCWHLWCHFTNSMKKGFRFSTQSQNAIWFVQKGFQKTHTLCFPPPFLFWFHPFLLTSRKPSINKLIGQHHASLPNNNANVPCIPKDWKEGSSSAVPAPFVWNAWMRSSFGRDCSKPWEDYLLVGHWKSLPHSRCLSLCCFGVAEVF